MIKALNAARVFGKGTREYDKRNFAEAFRLLKPVADSEPLSIPHKAVVASASYYVADMFLCGRGVQKDDSSAITYFDKAAKLGHPEAARHLNEIQSNKSN